MGRGIYSLLEDSSEGRNHIASERRDTRPIDRTSKAHVEAAVLVDEEGCTGDLRAGLVVQNRMRVGYNTAW